jgi:DNA phosphorothioation-dependent restriction protein DptH
MMFHDLVPELVEAIRVEFQHRSIGHCLRVDNLTDETAHRVCRELRGSSAVSFETYVLGGSTEEADTLRPDQAIELRNRKESSLCLIVPAGLGHVTASSLGNSFASFDLTKFLHGMAERLEHSFPDAVRLILRRVRVQLKGRASVSQEDLIEFYLRAKENPDASAIGRELWRVGLIPDPNDDFVQRLQRNRKCVDAIARPARPQNSASERLAATGLPDGPFKTRLAGYLSQHVLHLSAEWQKPIADHPDWADLAFNLWPFPDQEVSGLQAIEVKPFLDADGTVDAFCKLKQPNGAGASLQGQMGPGHKVTVRWTSNPPSPSGVKKWRIELIPSRREYGDEVASHLSRITVKNTNRLMKSANLSLDLEETEIRAVEIRVSGETERGLEVQNENGEVIYGFSNEFWLISEVDIELGETLRKKTELSLPMARLRASLEIKEAAAEIEESQPQWETGDEPWYFSTVLQQKYVARIAVSPIASQVEDYLRENPRVAWPWASIESDRALSFDDIMWDSLPDVQLEQKCWIDFLRNRELLTKELVGRAPRNRVASLKWDATLSERVRRYAKAYRELLVSADSEGLPWALKIDALQLNIGHPGDRNQTAALVLPLHPLRLLWHAAYADLLEHWRSELAKTPSKRERARRIEVAAVERLAPLNVPMFVLGPGPKSDRVHVFAQNLGLYLGAALPLETQEPARALAELASAIGLPSDLVSATDIPLEKLGQEFVEYRKLHSYTDTLRISISNPGDGYQVALALQHLYRAELIDQGQETHYPKLDIIAHSSEPMPLSLPGLDRLRDELYLSGTHQQASHLAPVAQVALRPIEQLPDPPGGDINLALLIDEGHPSLRCCDPIPDSDSVSVYGLLTRVTSDFRSTESVARWDHQVALPTGASRERHPTLPAYTADLVDTHRLLLDGVRRVLFPHSDSNCQPSLCIELSYEDRNRLDRIHHCADWVILLDRFIGIDLFDDPTDQYLATTARKYLLDYAPEFIEGLGHRIVVTTAWREEVEDILALAMKDLGFSAVEESVSEALHALKSVSGRLALRMIHDNTQAREAAGLAAVVAWLRSTGELTNSVLLPVDAHPEIFSVAQTRDRKSDSGDDHGTLSRCDLVQIRVSSNRLDVSFIEVKARSVVTGLNDLADRMSDQMEATEHRFRELFFNPANRVDHIIQRSKLTAVLRFYARRAARYGFFADSNESQEALRLIGKLESGVPQMKAVFRGFIVDLGGSPQKAFSHRGANFRILTAQDFEATTVFRSSVTVESGLNPPAPDPTLSEIESPSVLPRTPAENPPATRSSVIPAFLPPDRPIEIAVPLGLSLDEEIVDWKASVKGSPHLFVIGIPGQGKSVLHQKVNRPST